MSTPKKWFVFVDMEYYPYSEQVVADTAEEALREVSAGLPIGTVVYVVPPEAVETGIVHGPRKKPETLFTLLEEGNRIREERLRVLHGALDVRVEGGSIRP